MPAYTNLPQPTTRGIFQHNRHSVQPTSPCNRLFHISTSIFFQISRDIMDTRYDEHYHPPCDGTPTGARKRVHLLRPGQVWGHTPEQRVAASTLRRYSLVLRLAIAHADADPPCPYHSDRIPPDATMKRVDALSAWSSPSDLDNSTISLTTKRIATISPIIEGLATIPIDQ